MGTRWARFVRGWVVAVFSTLIAALSHSLAAGVAPSALAIVVSLAFAGMACVALAGKRISLWRMSVAVAFSQVIFHGIFASMSGSVPTSIALGHVHDAAQASVPLLAATYTPHAASHSGPLMVAAHVAAGVLTLAILRYGETAFWRLVDTTRVLLRVLFPTVPGIAANTTPRLGTRTLAPFTPGNLAVLLSGMRYRGPPAMRSLA